MKMNEQLNDINDQISLNEIYYVLKKHIRKILFITSIIIFIALMYAVIKRPVYQSSGMLMIEDPSSSLDIFEMGIGGDQNYLENEIEILSSRTTAERAVSKLLELNETPRLFLFNNKTYNHNWFRARFDNIYEALIEQKYYFTKSDLKNEDTFNDIVEKLQESMTVENSRNTDMLRVTIKSYDPDESALLVNTIIDVYKRIDLEWTTGEMFYLKRFLEEQLEIKEIELAQSEKDLQRFQENQKIFGIDNSSRLLLENLTLSESQLYNAIAQNNILNERKKFIENELSEEEIKLVQNVSNSINEKLAAIKEEIAIREGELVSAIMQQGGEDHEIVKSIKSKIKFLKKELEDKTRELIDQGMTMVDPIQYRQTLVDSLISLNSKSSLLNTKVLEMEKMVDQYELELGSLPEKVLEYTRLSRNLNIDSETYSFMRQKLEEARINEASQVGKVRTVDIAKPNDKKVSPKRIIIVFLSIIFGLIFSSIVAYIIELFDYTIKTILEIESRGLSILALIPSMGVENKNRKTKKYQSKLGNAEKIQRRLVLNEDPKSPISEAFRSLRTSLMYSNSNTNDDSNVIIVSSPGPGEGKTTNIVNLAITYANLGKKTIVIDGDLRKPVIHKVFNIPKSSGITSYLSNVESDYKKIINDTEIENLSVITSGIVPPNPSEILASNNMKTLINELKNKYEIILIDSPPLLAVTDTFVCMEYANQFVLVVRAGKTEKGGLDRALEQIKQTNSPLTGVVMNAVNEGNIYGGGYYYNYYQYYYGDNSEN